MPVRVAFVTNEMLHHKILAAELANSVNVRCIPHPHWTDPSLIHRLDTVNCPTAIDQGALEADFANGDLLSFVLAKAGA
ncbi:MAG: hypothetical protein GY724_17400 [Actinomycetia bacterium]|nr:hypothetical protein [Actinomycetes bacterium]MCP4222993.1 hypothetical protein [Actinomycetes bacterium]MCP5031899.1 hypothetical protein [Actinomycetes bacterium]